MQWTDADTCENIPSSAWFREENCYYFHQADNIHTNTEGYLYNKTKRNYVFQILPLMCSLQRNYDVIQN